MALEIIRVQQEAVARDGIIAAYVDGERLLIEAASNFFGLDRGNQDQMTADGLARLVAGVDDGRLSAFDAFSGVLDGRPGLKRSIEIEALGKLCGMYVERQFDEESRLNLKFLQKAESCAFSKECKL